MTFTVMGRCARTGALGFCQATSTPAVGWRISEVVPGRGVVTVQAHGDHSRLQAARAALAAGQQAAAIVASLRAGDPHAEFRQLAVLDAGGMAAVCTGTRARPWAGEVVGTDHIATGNVLVGPAVVESMSAAFVASAAEDLEERLLRAVEAGRDAGGQPEGQTSCALRVFREHDFPVVDLRVDVAAEPVREMRRILDWFKPLVPYYVQRTLDPSSVPPKKAWLEARGWPVNPYLRT